MAFLQNAWFVGITTGIISGIIVFFLTKLIMDKKGRTEYYKQVHNANLSLINVLKPYITDKGLPEKGVFKALIASTARSFQVAENDMYTIEKYCEELIREIMSDVYVSNDKKQEYATMLVEYKKALAVEYVITEATVENVARKEYVLTNKGKLFVSAYVAIISAMLAMITVTSTFLYEKQGENSWLNDNFSIIWLPFAIIIAVALTLVISIWIEILFIRHNRKK